MRVRNSLTKFKLNAMLTLLTMLSMTVVSACVTSAALPGADIAAGIHQDVSFEFLREHNESAESPPTPEASTSTAAWVPDTNSVHRVTQAASAPLPIAEVPAVTSGPTYELSPTPQPQMPTSTPVTSPTLRLSPRVLSFSAEQVETEEGERIGLTWEAEGEQATICLRIDEATMGCRFLFDVPTAGSLVIEPSDIVGAYTGFELIVEAGGVRAVRYAPLMVECVDRFSDWFFDDPPAICPREAPLSSYAAAQEFEHGRMIWIGAQDAYCILYDGFITPSGHQYISSKLTSLQILNGPLDLTAGASADNRVGEAPPNGFFEPVSGFGLVWRGEVVGVEGVRARLGWAMEPEYGFDTIYQCEMR